MRKVALFTVIFTVNTFSQFTPQNYTALDQYYTNNIITIEDSLIPVSEKIMYPGLRCDTATFISAGIRKNTNSHQTQFKQSELDTFYKSSNNYLGFNSLYLCGAYNWNKCQTGIWLGNLNFSKIDESNSVYESRDISANIALWQSFHNNYLKGVSLGVSFVDSNTIFYNSITHKEKGISNKISSNFYDFAVNSIWAPLPNFDLLIGYKYNHSVDIDFSNNRRDFTDNSYTIITETQKDTTTECSLYTGLISKKGQKIILGLSGIVIYNDYSLSDIYGYYNKSRDHFESKLKAGGFFELSDSRMFWYKKHSLDIGAKLSINIFATENSSESFDPLIPYRYFRLDFYSIDDMHTDHFTGSCLLSFPVKADICLFNSDFHAVLGFTPLLYGSMEKVNDVHYYNHKVDIDQAEIGFYGKFGEHVEFSLVPSIDSKILVTSAELKYRF